jgi:hypothetical protein
MKPKDRQKMCTHCEGRIGLDEVSCPYCGMPVMGDSIGSVSPAFQSALTPQDSLSSLYPPPYSNRNYAMKPDKDAASPFKTAQAFSENPFGKMPFQQSTTVAASITEKAEEEEKAGFMPLLFILIGSNLLTLGLMLGMFSEEGFLRLEWSSKYWLFYCLAAFPMIYLGLKKTK